MKYCYHCGNILIDEANFCTSCGCAQAGGRQTQQHSSPTQGSSDATLLSTLSVRIKTNGIIWIVIGAIQILLGTFINLFISVIGALNLVSAFGDINYSSRILQNPVGIVSNAQPLVRPIITLAYNFIAGGIIGVAGSIYYLVAVRGFILVNQAYFLSLESTNIN